MATGKIDGTPISCGVMYYHDLTLDSFKASLFSTALKEPEHIGWGSPGYEKRAREIDDYWLAQENSFHKGYCYIFSDNKQGEGDDIAAYIKKHKLGRLTCSGWATNPNSENKICTWIWRYNGKKVNASSNAAKRGTRNAKRKTASRRVGRRHGTR